MKHSVITLVDNISQAERVVDVLEESGFPSSDISLLMPDTGGARDFSFEQHSKAPEGTATGAGVGALLGGTLGVLAGIGAVAIPGLGPFIAAGPIMAGLSGVAVGGTVGGVAGGLIGLGMPEYEAKQYESKLQEGAILISVHTSNKDEAQRAKDIFKEAGNKKISVVSEEGVSQRRAS